MFVIRALIFCFWYIFECGHHLSYTSSSQSVAKRVAEQSSEIDQKEWSKIDDFLRTVYSAGDDMKAIAKTMDASKQPKAEEDYKLLQKLAQAAQGPVSKKDAEGFGTIAGKADRLFADFLDLMSDIPDEIWGAS